METIHTQGTSEVALLTEAGEVDALLALFQEVADELGWKPGEWLSQSPSNSLHFGTLDRGELAGGLQIVLPDSAGRFPCHRVWSEVELPNPSQTVHITILALGAEYRGREGLFWSLCVEMWRYCVAQKMEAVLLECTPPMLKLYRRIGWPLKVIGELRMHWGEECYLCQMQVLEFAGSILARAIRSSVYRELVCQAYRVA
ncbi:MAG: hypothetical protein NT023_04365 [Armatimonadetes bacterium]|nr:hypothetical protein [Armatimonadota bacterium]